MNFGRRILLILTFLFLSGPLLYAQNFISSQLELIAKYIGLSAPTIDGTYYNYTQFNDLPITVVVSNGEITHIGLSLFTPTQRELIDNKHCDFLERISLTSYIPNFYDVPIHHFLRDEKVIFLDGVISDLEKLTIDTTFSFRTSLISETTHLSCWYKNDVENCIISVSYPADFDLITGMTYDEAERRLYKDICHARLNNHEVVSTFDPELLKYNEDCSCYTLEGDTFRVANLSSNRYYVKDGKENYALLFSEDFPLQSLANLLTGVDVENQFEMDIRSVRGFESDKFTVPLKSWIAFFIQSGCTPYFGVISYDEQEIVALLLMRNKELGYLHSMKFSINSNTLKEKKGVLYAKLYSYIPFKNLKSIFHEIN